MSEIEQIFSDRDSWVIVNTAALLIEVEILCFKD